MAEVVRYFGPFGFLAIGGSPFLSFFFHARLKPRKWVIC
jgi:hypothetical protein